MVPALCQCFYLMKPIANISLAVFLLILGGTMLVDTEIPKWVVGLAAVITGVIVGLSAFLPPRT